MSLSVARKRVLAYPAGYGLRPSGPAVKGSLDMPRVALTDRFVAHAKPDATGRTDYFDASTKGLALRVSDSSRSWTYHFTSPKDGKRARLSLGSYPALSLAVARARAIEARAQLEDGADPRDAARADALTVAGLIEAYLDKHVRPSLRTAPAIERRFRKNVLPIIGGMKVAELHRRDANRVIDPIVARECPAEANRVFEDMRGVLRWAVARGDLDHSPLEGLSKPSAMKARERVLSEDEIRTLWAGLPKSLARSQACQRIVKLCLVTCQRVGEVAGMRRDELDLTAKVWALPGNRTKNGQAHRVPLSDLAISIIEEALGASGNSEFVFPAGGGALPPHAVARTIGRAQEASEARPLGRFGIAHWTAHDLRRTALTNLAKLGVAPIVAGAVANHRSVTKGTVTLAVYTQYGYDKEKREALDLWADRLTAILSGGAEVYPLAARRA